MAKEKENPPAENPQAAQKQPPTFEEVHREAILKRMAAGLTKDQAIQCVQAQLAWDNDPANTSDKPKTAKADK